MNDELYLLVIVSTVVFLVLSAFIVGFLFLFQRRQLQNRQQQLALKAAYDQELLQTQLEVQNQTLQQVGHDLHDNIGQLLSLTRLHINILLEEVPIPPASIGHLDDLCAVVDLSIREVRSLTKSLDSEFMQRFGFLSSLQHELDRLEQTGRFTTELTLTGEPFSLGFQREIVLFRVVQELINNVLKHAQANQLTITGTFTPTHVEWVICDNGRGFDPDLVLNQTLNTSGAGLRTIRRRTELIGGTCHLDSAPGTGSRTTLTVPNRQ